MKQNPHSAQIKKLIVVLFMLALILLTTACATLPRKTSEAKTDLMSQKVKGLAVININTAPGDELEKLPGIGAVIAGRIVEHRKQYGPFRRAEHLMMVRGISDQKFRAIREMIVVD